MNLVDFVGYDPVETVAYHVCCNSILENASVPVSLLDRITKYACAASQGEKDSAEFAICRF